MRLPSNISNNCMVRACKQTILVHVNCFNTHVSTAREDLNKQKIIPVRIKYGYRVPEASPARSNITYYRF